MSKDYMLTTVDNPYNPFDQFALWLLFDKEFGYNTCEYLARIAHTSNSLSDEENEEETSRAIDEILKYDFECIYKKVTREVNYDKILTT